MSRLKLSPAMLSGLLVAIIAFATFCIRVFPSYKLIFKGDWVKFGSPDAYYQMHLVDNMAANFPNMSTFDPYLVFPGGTGISGSNFFIHIIANISSVFGLTTPDQRAIDVVGAFLPPVLAVLTVIVVYFIGKELFGRWGGVMSAALLMILPGEYFSRSKLGFTDYHVLEVFLTTTAILFLILAIKTARDRELDFGHLIKLDWAVIRKPLIYSMLTGFFLGLYGLTWTGAPLFIFIIFVYMIIQFIIDHMFRRSTAYLSIVGIPVFLVCLIVILPGSVRDILPTSLLVGTLGLTGLGLVSRIYSARNLKPVIFPVTVLVMGLAGAGIFYLIYPGIFNSMTQMFSLFYPRGLQWTTSEMQPLISSLYGNGFEMYKIVWSNYRLSFFLNFFSMAILIYFMVKKGNPEKNLLFVWSVIILIIHLGQRRFGYYFGINTVLLNVYLAWFILENSYSRIFTEKLKQQIARARQAVKKKTARRRQNTSVTTPYVIISLVTVLVFFLVYFWNIEPVKNAADRVTYAPHDGWCSALEWMKENTPEPFGDPEVYYELEDSGKYLSISHLMNMYADPGNSPDFYTTLPESYPYPDSAYGVLSWWDYGYWITRIAHRLPSANPGQDPRIQKAVASFFTAQDEETAETMIQQLDSRYIVIDLETAYVYPLTFDQTGNVHPITGDGKFPALRDYAGFGTSEYLEMLFIADPYNEDRLIQAPFFYPEYFQSMAVRMYNFDCQAVTDNLSTWVISTREIEVENGDIIKVVPSVQQFDTYEEATAFIDSQETGNYRLASMNAMKPCVPLEPLEQYKIIYASREAEQVNDTDIISFVKIFEYVNYD